MVQLATYAFGPFRLETDTQLLRHEEVAISLQPKVYRLLLYFLEHPGRLISREELFDALWHGRVVEDTALRLAINGLRKALSDESKMPRYIQTACKRGYRFLPEVYVEAAYQGARPAAKITGMSSQPRIERFGAVQDFNGELQQLLDAYEQAAAGKRCLVFLNGVRGIGKTALLESFLTKINNTNSAVLSARCVQLGGVSEPFMPLLEALESRCREPYGGKSLIDCLHRIAPTWLYQMLNVLEPEDFISLYPKVSNINTGRMLREGADFFEALGSESPCILILDNSQWSDEFTLDLLSFLVLRCVPTKLLMIVSYRPNETTSGNRRLKAIREELVQRGLCRELSLQKRNLVSG